MTTSYKDLLQQREALEKAIADARTREVSGAISQVRALAAEYGLTAEDIFPSGRAAKAAGTKANEVDKNAFIAASKAIYAEFGKEVPGGGALVDKAVALGAAF